MSADGLHHALKGTDWNNDASTEAERRDLAAPHEFVGERPGYPEEGSCLLDGQREAIRSHQNLRVISEPSVALKRTWRTIFSGSRHYPR